MEKDKQSTETSNKDNIDFDFTKKVLDNILEKKKNNKKKKNKFYFKKNKKKIYKS